MYDRPRNYSQNFSHNIQQHLQQPLPIQRSQFQPNPWNRSPIYHGEKDDVIFPKYAVDTAKLIGEEKCILTIVKGLSHISIFESP